ncbi:MAG: seryl-tRNA synthetase [Candidatus Parcubacteria bacterium]|jgi:seryl-tRNA synthetase
MLDITFIREHADLVKKNVAARHVSVDVDALLKVDEERLALLKEVETLRKERNEVAGRMKGIGADERDALIQRGKEIKEMLSVKEAVFTQIDQAWTALLLQIPNMSHPSTPMGKDDHDNVEVRRFGEPASIPDAKDHLQLGEMHDLIDFERGAKVAGAKFYFLKGRLVILEQALIRFAIDQCIKHGFTPMTTPDVARDTVLVGTGFNPRGPESQIYSLENSDLSLIGTAEITVGGYHMDEVIPEAELPRRYVALSHCYRTEAGTYGRESYGLYRVHQFSKVEMFVLATPEQSEALHEELLRIEEDIWKQLEVPFRVVDICTGDLGGPAYRKYDLEAWMPGKSSDKKEALRGDWGEVTSTSNCTDYQARRLNTKVRRTSGETEFLHTLNGTAVSLARALVAIMENGQQEDGSIHIPKALVPYCGFETLT